VSGFFINLQKTILEDSRHVHMLFILPVKEAGVPPSGSAVIVGTIISLSLKSRLKFEGFHGTTIPSAFA
jgi:hypothetical protein